MVSSRDCFARIGALLLVLQMFGCQRDEGSSYDRLTELMERNAEAESHRLSSSWRWKVISRIEVSITGWLSLEYVYSLDISGETTLSVLVAWLMFLKYIWRERASQGNYLAIPTTGVTRISVRLWIIDPPRSRQLNSSLRRFNYYVCSIAFYTSCRKRGDSYLSVSVALCSSGRCSEEDIWDLDTSWRIGEC
jgi:hypothetical protein